MPDMRTLRWLFIPITLCIGFGLLSGCSAPGNSATEPTDNTPILLEDTSLTASAEFIPERTVTLSFTNGAQNAQILVKPGESGSDGQLLASADTAQLEISIALAQASVQRAEAALEQLNNLPTSESVAAAEAALANARVNYDRLDRNDARSIEMDAAQAQVDSAQAALDAILAGATETQIRLAESDLTGARLNLQQAQNALVTAEIHAPFAGTIIEVYAHSSENLPPSQPVFLLADLSSMQLQTTDLSEVDTARVQVGNTVSLSVDALPGTTLTGTVIRIAEKASPGSGVYYTVTIDIPQLPATIRWGMSAFVTFTQAP
jgi:multidrug efflux pump subunit AcrA (membrane-fusion protein)